MQKRITRILLLLTVKGSERKGVKQYAASQMSPVNPSIEMCKNMTPK